MPTLFSSSAVGNQTSLMIVPGFHAEAVHDVEQGQIVDHLFSTKDNSMLRDFINSVQAMYT